MSIAASEHINNPSIPPAPPGHAGSKRQQQVCGSKKKIIHIYMYMSPPAPYYDEEMRTDKMPSFCSSAAARWLAMSSCPPPAQTLFFRHVNTHITRSGTGLWRAPAHDVHSVLQTQPPSWPVGISRMVSAVSAKHPSRELRQ